MSVCLEHIPLVSSFCLIPCGHVCILTRTVRSLDLGEVTLHRRHPVWPSSTLHSGTRPVCSRGVSDSYRMLPYVVEGLTVEGMSGAGPWPVWLHCCDSCSCCQCPGGHGGLLVRLTCAGQCPCFRLIVGGAASLCV